MLKSLKLKQFTLFKDAEFKFGKSLNLIVGENGTGKTHILKAAYSAIAVSAEVNGASQSLTKTELQRRLADKLQAVFKPDGLWRLVRRRVGRHQCEMSYRFHASDMDMAFSFSTVSRKEVKLKTVPTRFLDKKPVYLPTRELLSLIPAEFVALYDETRVSFDETWRDTCKLFSRPLARGPREARIKALLQPIEGAMGGTIDADKAGRFYLNLRTGILEMHLVAEGLRKLAMIARLIANGTLLDQGFLFWDEPECNLNPKLIKTIARTILEISKNGIQVFVATHSLFLMREIDILTKQEYRDLDTRCFGLHFQHDGGVTVLQGDGTDDIGDITALNEELQQSDRYINTEMGLPANAASAGDED